jgi:hypothetical protein
MTDVYSNIQAGKYENTIKWFTEPDPIKRTKLRDAHSKEQRRIDEEFYQDCCDELEIDPKAASSEELFQKAYEDGHGFGYQDIYSHLVDLYEFIQVYNGLKRGED